jgi:hypothetical protein
VYTARQSLNITEDLVEQLKADEELCRNINSCAQNQSRIADDVLALARINLDMLHFVMVSADDVDRARRQLGSSSKIGSNDNTEKNTGRRETLYAGSGIEWHRSRAGLD